jgi:hypothetical protein
MVFAEFGHTAPTPHCFAGAGDSAILVQAEESRARASAKSRW